MSRAAAFAANAPLMGVPGAFPPPGGKGEWFRGAGGLRLRAAFWNPSPARGTVFLSPGRTEPIEKYYELIGDLLARGFAVVAHDWRGQGLSARLLPDRLRGHARTPEGHLEDYRRLLDAFENRAPQPWIAIGHSMGGCLNLVSLIGGEHRIAAALLSSPMLRIKTGKRSMWSVKFATRWNVRNGKAAEYVLDDSDDPFQHTFEKDALTTDERRYELWREQLYACPHLALGGVTWGWLAFALELGDRATKPKSLKRVRIPVTVVQAGDDSRVHKSVSRLVARRLAKGRYVEAPGARHEVLLEVDDRRDIALSEFDGLADLVAPRMPDAAESIGAPSSQVETRLEPYA